MTPTTTDYNPFTHAAELGLEIIYTDRELRPQDDGAYFLERGTIHLRPGMFTVQERCVLTHELGHALNGHHDDRAKHEVIADRFAAEQLVHRTTLIELMGMTPDAARWAYDLGVTTKILRVYLNVHRMDLARGRTQPYRTRLAV